MTAKQAGTFYRVRDVLDAFIGMGCDLKTAEGTLYDDDGSVFNVRYLVDPKTKRFAVVQDLDDSEYVSAEEVEQWQRRTGISIPLPQPL